MKFKGKSVIVTGGSNGIGKAIALHFGKEGAFVTVNYASSETSALEVVKMIEESGGKAIAYKANVASYEESEALVNKAIETYGKVDILINNSGITKDQLMLRMSEDDFDQVINVNLKGTWNMIKHATRPMLKQKYGRIINISSVVGLIGNPGQANYVASKAGVIGMTKALAKEFGKKQVTVNAVAPGFIETKMTDNLPEAVKIYYLDQIPLGRLGQVEDIANAVAFLASDEAGYITGQTISVNGGMI
ncbi:3-oxoacyl-[acyl-carrier-protein] reductase [Liberiplasma polymorphum]|uniref:3-oxoacyl-[acyl-carrier-protein] reductase n=1 Tax=Liberiplasma polymorphum TaxID=3374570 RepID=UPI00377224C7